MKHLYKSPEYYEIAFSFRNIPSEVDIFEKSIKNFSHIPVKKVLEIACGNSPHMEELINRGYEYTGIDLSREMIEYSKLKASNREGKADFFCGDMVNFKLDQYVDFAYIMLGSFYIKNTSELISHFNSVGQVLKKGGLYLLDWCVQFDPLRDKKESWEIESDGIKVKTNYSMKLLNSVEQTYEEVIILEVNDHGICETFEEKTIRRGIFPQEFLIFLSGRNDFEFAGWWNNWDLSRPLEGNEVIRRPIVIVRKK